MSGCDHAVAVDVEVGAAALEEGDDLGGVARRARPQSAHRERVAAEAE